MTLDTSHIRNNENILNVHLSAREQSKQHLPIDNFCKEVVGYLVENNWKGNVILEYLFEFHDQLLNDLELLKTAQWLPYKVY